MKMLTVCLVELSTRIMTVLIPPGILDCHHEETMTMPHLRLDPYKFNKSQIKEILMIHW